MNRIEDLLPETREVRPGDLYQINESVEDKPGLVGAIMIALSGGKKTITGYIPCVTSFEEQQSLHLTVDRSGLDFVGKATMVPDFDGDGDAV